MPAPFEVHAELDEGFSLTTGAPWSGLRVKYRRLGSSGRWSRFLLSYDRTPTIAELQDLCAAHEAGAMPTPKRPRQ